MAKASEDAANQSEPSPGHSEGALHVRVKKNCLRGRSKLGDQIHANVLGVNMRE